MVVSSFDIYVCVKAINEVQEKVAQLKNRVAGFLLVIAKVGKNTEKSLEKTSKDVMDELKELKEYVRNAPSPFFWLMSSCRCLALINHRLQTINDQSTILTTLLPVANMKVIDECVNAFQDSIARFQVIFFCIL